MWVGWAGLLLVTAAGVKTEGFILEEQREKRSEGIPPDFPAGVIRSFFNYSYISSSRFQLKPVNIF